jgi:hypothetical protein
MKDGVCVHGCYLINKIEPEITILITLIVWYKLYDELIRTLFSDVVSVVRVT